VFKENNKLVVALQSLKTALQINPDYAEAQQNYSSLLGSLSNYDDVVKHSDIALALKDSPTIWESRLFAWIYHPDLSAETICNEHARWGERFPEPQDASFSEHDRSTNRRLRVGYVSPDFRDHSCRYFFEPLFSQHDHTHFELFAYSNVKLEGEDEHTQRFKTYFDAWRNIRHITDEEVFKMIRQDQIDILIDGCGHMKDTRLELFALKPAPIQITWLGAAWTTGLKQMDYALYDPFMAPSEIQGIEQAVRLRNWGTYRPGEKARGVAVTTLPALSNGYITFGYSGRTERLNYKVFRTWARVLICIPDARLIIDYKCFADPATCDYFRSFMAGFGMDISRVTLRFSDDIFEALGEVDVLLDSFPHSGGTMLYDAVWMGVPIITLASRPPVGRIGTSLMINLDLPHWVAQDEDEYVSKAVGLTQDVEGLAELRAGMRERMSGSNLMDEKGFASDVENTYQKIWQTWCMEVNN
jgi:predicted O-linked N-acetylglucosamine transferase (SPINDLY family)